MGGLCSRRSTENNFDNHVNGASYGLGVAPARQPNNESSPSVVGESMEDNNKHTLREPFSFPEMTATSYALDDNDGIPRLARALSHKSRSTKSNLAAVKELSMALIRKLDGFMRDSQSVIVRLHLKQLLMVILMELVLQMRKRFTCSNENARIKSSLF